MENMCETIVSLVGNEVCKSMLSLPRDAVFSDDFLFELYNTSKAHDIAHIIGSALINNSFLKESAAENIFRDEVYFTAFRYENQRYVLEKVCEVLENSKIPYIPLKGAVLSGLYPEPWMRMGCDIDILVHEQDTEKAVKAITDNLGYKQTGIGSHDISILSTENIYIELHFSLVEEDYSPAAAKVLGEVWEHSKPLNGGCGAEMSNEMFYFYHIAHMAKHFIGGGCGIRPFLDLWLMNKDKNYHTAETKALLKRGKLTEFAETAEKLCDVWFSGKEHDEVTVLMQDYILNGGSFGSEKTKMLSNQQRSGGRVKYILSRIFVPYDDLKGQYPILKKYRFLTPFCEICRLFSLLFGKKKKFRKTYVGSMISTTEEQLNDTKLLFERVGLS